MSNLLHIYQVGATEVRKRKRPLVVEFHIPRETSPYLISTSSACMWVEKPLGNGTLRAAVRKSPLGDLFFEIVVNVAHRSREEAWGSVHPYTAEGLQAAIEYVKSYDMGDVEVLLGRERCPKWADEKALGIPVHLVDWLPSGYAIVLPVDRSFVGQATCFGDDLVAVIAHNPSRSIGIATER